MRILFWTLRLEIKAAPDTNPYLVTGRRTFLYAVWHDSVVFPTFGGRHVNSTALISHHRDGAFVASILSGKRIGAIRGSTHRGGGTALRSMMEQAQTQHIIITPDGPRGPRRQMSDGILYLASRTGHAIVPTAFACHRFWQIPGSWTNLVIPMPFSRVYLLTGEPISIPAGATRTELELLRHQVQGRMDHLNDRALVLAQAF